MNTRWLQLEYLGKGISLALVAVLALEAPHAGSTAVFFGAAALGLVLLLGLAAMRKIKEGYRVAGRSAAFLLFLLLENPVLVYTGVLGGMMLAMGVLVGLGWMTPWRLLIALASGGALGVIFWLVRHVGQRWVRRGAVLLLAATAVAGSVFWLQSTGFAEESRRVLIGVHVLLAIPLLYLLTLAGRAEETELEIGAMCAALGVALWILLPETGRLIALVLPGAIYVVYTHQVLRKLQVFKHVLRGLSYNNLGRHREALLAYRRALQLDPANRMAQEGRWRVHKAMDFGQVVHDPETMALVDLDLCLNRAVELLTTAGPNADRLAEAHKLLTLVLDQRPAMQPAVYYWRAVAHTHAREFDKAEAEVRTVLESSNYAPDDHYRQAVLLPCWQLALLQHSELKRRIGLPLLNEGKRLEAIAAVEKHLAKVPADAGAAELKRLLYDGVTEDEYRKTAGERRSLAAAEFDHEYCLQLGQALLGDAAQWRRGAEYLRLAALGITGKGPLLYGQIAQACQQAGDEDAAKYNMEMVKLLAREQGVRNLGAEEKQTYFATVKYLGETAYGRGEVEKAIENLTLYAEAEQSGLDTLRILTELYEKKGDALAALHINEKALLYDGKNKQLLERKDRYYFSVSPAQLRERLEVVKNTFDVGYCVKKAKTLLDHKAADGETVDWGLHLAELARVLEPENLAAKVLVARARLKRGEQGDAITLLEDARAAKPERFASADEEEAWYTACRLLGDFYLGELGKPDQALLCFNDYRKYPKSGADTLYKMGQAYEQLGDRVRAAKCYQNVTIYDHPLASDAYIALQRLEVRAS